jgi:hypothetical protein
MKSQQVSIPKGGRVSPLFFVTGFLIHHSFLDFLYIGFFPPFGEIDCPRVKYPLPVMTCVHDYTVNAVFLQISVKSEN